VSEIEKPQKSRMTYQVGKTIKLVPPTRKIKTRLRGDRKKSHRRTLSQGKQISWMEEKSCVKKIPGVRRGRDGGTFKIERVQLLLRREKKRDQEKHELKDGK